MKKKTDDKRASFGTQKKQVQQLTALLTEGAQAAKQPVVKRSSSRNTTTREQIEQEVAARYEAALQIARQTVTTLQSQTEALNEQVSILSIHNGQYETYTAQQTEKLTKQKAQIKLLESKNSEITEELTDVSEQLLQVRTTVEGTTNEARDLKIANASLESQVEELKTFITQGSETVQNATKTQLALSDKTRDLKELQDSIANRLEDQAKLHQHALDEERRKYGEITGALSSTRDELASVQRVNLDLTHENSTLKDTTTQQDELINGALAELQVQIPPMIEKLKEGSRAIPLAIELLEAEGYYPEQIRDFLAGNDAALTAPPEAAKDSATTPQRNERAKEEAERLLGFSLTTSSSAAPKKSAVTSKTLQFASLDSDSDDEKGSAKPTAARQPSSVAGSVSSNQKGVTSTTSQQKTGFGFNR